MIIDSQVHAYEANTPERPWHTVPNWPDHVTGDEMVAAMDRVGVDGAILGISIGDCDLSSGSGQTAATAAASAISVVVKRRMLVVAGLGAKWKNGD